MTDSTTNKTNSKAELIADVEIVLAQLSSDHPIRTAWSQTLEFLEKNRVRSYYIHTQADYWNIGILTSNMIFDIEYPSPTGTAALTTVRLRTLDRLMVNWGPFPTIRYGSTALLSFLVVGSDGQIGSYWTAQTENDVERLRVFANAVLKAQLEE